MLASLLTAPLGLASCAVHAEPTASVDDPKFLGWFLGWMSNGQRNPEEQKKAFNDCMNRPDPASESDLPAQCTCEVFWPMQMANADAHVGYCACIARDVFRMSRDPERRTLVNDASFWPSYAAAERENDPDLEYRPDRVNPAEIVRKSIPPASDAYCRCSNDGSSDDAAFDASCTADDIYPPMTLPTCEEVVQSASGSACGEYNRFGERLFDAPACSNETRSSCRSTQCLSLETGALSVRCELH